jgi:hypothetical protein
MMYKFGWISASTFALAHGQSGQEFIEDPGLASNSYEDSLPEWANEPEWAMESNEVPDFEASSTPSIQHPRKPLYDQEESNNLIRTSDTGQVDLKFFENYILKPEKTKVRFGQSWFVGLFDSKCTTDKCQAAAENFEQLFLIWLGETTNKAGLDYEEEESWLRSDDNTSLDSFKIA